MSLVSQGTAALPTDKNIEFYGLQQGDKVKLTDGSEMEFVRHKQKKFIAMMNGNSYDVPNSMFVKLLEKAVKDNEWYTKLKKDDPFYIVDGKNCHAYYFIGIEGDRIIGLHPVTKARVRITKSFEGGKL